MVQPCQIRFQLISSPLSIWFKTLHYFKCHLNCLPSITRQLSSSSNRFLSIRIQCIDKILMSVESIWILLQLVVPPYQTPSLNHQHFKTTCKHRDRSVRCITTTTIKWVALIWPFYLMKLIFSRSHLFNRTAKDQVIQCQTTPSEQFMKKGSIRGRLYRQDLVHNLFKIDKLHHQLEVNNRLSFNNYREFLGLLSKV